MSSAVHIWECKILYFCDQNRLLLRLIQMLMSASLIHSVAVAPVRMMPIVIRVAALTATRVPHARMILTNAARLRAYTADV